MYDDVTYVYDEQVQRVTCDLNAMNTEEQDRLRRAFSKVLSIVSGYRKCTMALTLQNLCAGANTRAKPILSGICLV